MGLIAVLNHVLNFLFVPLALGALSAVLAKLAWRRELAAVAWHRLALPAALGAAAAALAGLVLLGRDGRIASYAAMTAWCALSLWWRGFGPGRR